jgi:hypothetical protein
MDGHPTEAIDHGPTASGSDSRAPIDVKEPNGVYNGWFCVGQRSHKFLRGEGVVDDDGKIATDNGQP